MEIIFCPKCEVEPRRYSHLCDKCGLDLRKINDLLNKGESSFNQEKYQDAISFYEKAIKMGRKNPLAWYGKGNVLLKLGENSEDVSLCVKCHLCPVLSEAFYNDAISCYNKAIDLDPKFKDAWYKKGVALEKLGDALDAKKCFETAKELK